MIGSAGLPGIFAPVSERPCSRSFAYAIDACQASSESPCPCMPTPRRAWFIIVNMHARPSFGLPSSQPTDSLKCITHVGEAWIPILCSIEPQVTPLAAPHLPFASDSSFGTTNRLMPLVPGGASGVRARTRWMMFSVRSCSPAVMKILVPVIANEPSPRGSALVRRMPRSLPEWASVRHIVPAHSPETILGR